MEFWGCAGPGGCNFSNCCEFVGSTKYCCCFYCFRSIIRSNDFGGWMADAVDEYCSLGWLVGWWIRWFLWNIVQITGNHFDYCFYMCLVVCWRGCVPNHLINGRPTSKWGLLFWHAFRSRTMLNHSEGGPFIIVPCC